MKRWMDEFNKTFTRLTTLLNDTEAKIDALTNEITVLTTRINLAKDEVED